MNKVILSNKRLLIYLTLFFHPYAYSADWENPEFQFDAGKLERNKVTIEWKRVGDVQAECEKESRKRGNEGFKFALQACSFWWGNSCVVITGKKTSLHSLGHEMRHCFQGEYH